MVVSLVASSAGQLADLKADQWVVLMVALLAEPMVDQRAGSSVVLLVDQMGGLKADL